MKKYGFLIFWGLFVAYFIFVHPCIIYYNGGTQSVYQLANNSPYWALGCLALSLIIWCVWLVIGGWFLVFSLFSKMANIRFLQKNGQRKSISISSVKKINNDEVPLLNVRFRLENFAGSEIEDTLFLKDRYPHRNRFVEGARHTLLLDPQLKRKPYCIMEDAEVQLNTGNLLLRILFLLLFFCGVGAYYYWAYQQENLGYGWRFFSASHPLFLIPFIALGVALLLYFIFVKLLKTAKDPVLLYRGRQTMASVMSISQTGTVVNEAHQILFELSFTDEKGMVHQASVKRLVSPLEMPSVASLSTVSIFYLPQDPSRLELEEVLIGNA